MSPPSAAASGKAIDDAVARVLDHCQFILGPEVKRVRGGTGRLLRRAPRGHLRQRHRRAGAGADGARASARATRCSARPSPSAPPPKSSRWSARRRCSSTSTRTPSTSTPRACARDRAPRKRLGLKPEGGDPGRPVRPAGRLRRHRGGRASRKPVGARRRGAGFRRRLGDRKVGTFGDVTATSFFPAKPLGCYGDGGAIFTDDDALAEVLRSCACTARAATDTTTSASG